MKLKIRIKSPKKIDIEDLLNFLAKELNINENIELLVAYNESLLDHLSNNKIEYKALLHTPVKDHYVLYIKEDVSSIQYIICHEMVHLQQYERGDLQLSSDLKTISWKGQTYSNQCDYEDREWEQEAFSKEGALWKKYKRFKKKQDETTSN